MTDLFAKILCGLAVLCLLGAGANAASAGASAAASVFVLPVEGAIDKSMLFVFRRAFREVEKLKPQAVILELNTPGGVIGSLAGRAPPRPPPASLPVALSPRERAPARPMSSADRRTRRAA